MIFSLLCSLSWIVIENIFNSHLSSTSFNIINNGSYNDITSVIYVVDKSINSENHYEFIKHKNNITCLCTSIEIFNTAEIYNYIDYSYIILYNPSSDTI